MPDRNAPGSGAGRDGDTVTAQNRVGGPSRDSVGAAETGGPLERLRLSVYVSAVELRRGIRWALAQQYILVGFALVTALTVPGLWITFQSAREFGAAIGPAVGPPAEVRIIAAGSWLFLTAMFVVSGVGSNGDFAEAKALLSMRPARDLVGGLLLAETVKYVPFVVVTVGVSYAGLAAGVGSPRPFLGGILVGVVGLSTAAAVGYPIGLMLKGILRRSSRSERLKPLLAVTVGSAYLLVILTGEVHTVVGLLDGVLRAPPLGWLGDLALMTTARVHVSTSRVVGAVALAAIVVMCGTGGVVRAATYAWYADRAPNSAAVEHTETATDESPVVPVLSVCCRQAQTAGIANALLVRAIRAPIQLLFAVGPPFVVAVVFGQLLVGGRLPWYTPWVVIVTGGWIAGTSFALNPIGVLGPSLPLLLTSPTEGRHVVRGTVIATMLPLVLPVTLLTLGAGLSTSQPQRELVLVVVTAPVVLAAASVVATAVGVTFPRFESIDITDGTAVVPPNKIALSVFAAVLLAGIVVLALVIDPRMRAATVTLVSSSVGWAPGASTLLHIGTAALAVLAVGCAVCYVRACRSISGYTID